MQPSLKTQLSKGTAFIAGGGVLVKIFGLAYVLLVVSQLSVYQYGLIKLALSIPAMLSLLTLSGLLNVMVTDVSLLREKKDVEGMRYLVSSFFSLSFISGISSFFLLFGSTYVASGYFHEGVLDLVRILSLIFLAGPIRSLILLVLNVEKNFKGLASFSLLEEVLKFVLTAIFLVVLDYGMSGVIISYVLANLIPVALYSVYIARFKTRLLDGKLLSRGILKPFHSIKLHAKWSIMVAGVHNLMSSLRLWIIQFILGTEAVGIYGLVTSLLRPVENLVPISKVVLPILPAYKNKRDVLVKIVNSAIKYKLLALIAIVSIAAAVLPILTNFYLQDYSDAYLLFIACALSFIPQPFSQMFGLIFHTFQLQKNLFFATSVNFVTVLVVLPVCLLVFGLYGVAVEMFITQSAYMISRYRSLKKWLPEYNVPLSDFVTYTETDKYIVNSLLNRLPGIRR